MRIDFDSRSISVWTRALHAVPVHLKEARGSSRSCEIHLSSNHSIIQMRMQKDILTHPKCEFSDIFCDVPLSIQAKTLWDGYIKHSTAETSSFVCLGQACENKEEAEATIAHYLRMDGTKAHFKVRIHHRIQWRQAVLLLNVMLIDFTHLRHSSIYTSRHDNYTLQCVRMGRHGQWFDEMTCIGTSHSHDRSGTWGCPCERYQNMCNLPIRTEKYSYTDVSSLLIQNQIGSLRLVFCRRSMGSLWYTETPTTRLSNRWTIVQWICNQY